MQTDLQGWRIYFDTCCLSRLFDKQIQPRIRREAQVISRILDRVRVGYWHWISSNVLVEEVERVPDPGQRSQIMNWLTIAHQTVAVGSPEISRGKQLEALGFKELDALHIACSESGEADIFLTTDDGILRRAKHSSSNLYVQVANPYAWLQGGEENEYIGND